MASLSAPTPDLQNCAAYCATDPVLGQILVFYHSPASPVARVEAHILSCAGFQSYPKLAISLSSPLYAAVNHLPAQKQHSDIYRGLAIAVLKYFSELTKNVKETILRRSNGPGEGQAVAFDEMHAGDLAARLKEIEGDTVAHDLTEAFAERIVNHVDVDVVVRLPEGLEVTLESQPYDVERYLQLFGDSTNLPHSKLKRTASKVARPKPRKEAAEALARELEELRKTEENYVAKLQELFVDIVQPLKRRGGSIGGVTGSLSGKDLDSLFPPCLEQIIQTNQEFLTDIMTGDIGHVATVCTGRFPEFKKPYEEYMRASADFPQLIAKFTKDKNSSFSRKIQQCGEQKLRSLTIEPVQRLPRYSLLIDNIINLLEPNHPSLQPLNDAREMITAICSLQSSEKDERSTTTKRLQSIIISWPAGFQPRGRLIAAVDFNDISPPYNGASSDAYSSILLLFLDCIVILRRPKTISMGARAVLAEIDRPGGGTSSGSGNKKDGLGQDLQFAGWVDISSVRTTTSDHGTNLWLTLTDTLKDAWEYRASASSIRKMQLLGQYEGRASKVEEEFVKARLERRCGSSSKGIVGLREIRYQGLAIWSCIWGSQARYVKEQKKSSTVVYLDIGRETISPGRSGKELMGEIGKGGVDIAICVEEAKGKMSRIECRSWSDYSSTDTVSFSEILPVLTKRISSVLRVHASTGHIPLTSIMMATHRRLLRSLSVPFEGESRFSKLRPPSPVKLFSSILNSPGSPSKSKPVLLERSQSQILPPKQFDRTSTLLMRGATALGLGGSEEPEEEEGEKGEEMRHRIRMDGDSPLKKLEDTFEAFVNALRIIGSEGADLHPLHALDQVDQTAMNTLLDQLIEDPKSGRLERDMGIDVVFVSFRSFLNQEWKNGMGPIISQTALKELQHKSDTLFPRDFEDAFKILMLEWTPQNKRAFRTIISQLREMQSKVEREDWKGVMTKAFTGLLVGEGNPLDYMGLVDRLVEDMGVLFTEGCSSSGDGAGTIKRAKSVNTTGSISSTASLRKRFGQLTHTSSMRDDRRGRDMDSHEKPHLVWRTLSKRDKDTYKGHMARSKSTDYDTRTTPKRPQSRERPTALGVFPNSSQLALQPSTPARPLSTIVASPVITPGVTTPASMPLPGKRPKRRSSLSDLTSHPDYQKLTVPHLSPTLHIGEHRYTGTRGDSRERRRTPSPLTSRLSSRPSSRDETKGFSSPSLSSSPPKSVIPVRKRSNTSTPTSMPTSVISAQPQRLKMQSATKLRERLESEKRMINGINPDLTAELDAIGKELSTALTLAPTHDVRQKSLYENTALTNSRALQDLQTRLVAVESKTMHFGERLTRAEAAERAAKAQLYDAMQENDIMFENFNKELIRVVAGFKAGKGTVELERLLQEARTQQAELKRENMILRRNNKEFQAQFDSLGITRGRNGSVNSKR